MPCNRPFIVVAARYVIPYDGTNSAKIAEHITDFTVVSETTTDLTFTSGGTTRSVARGGYIDYAGGVVSAVYQNEDDLNDAVVGVSSVDHVHDVVLHSGGAKPAPSYPAP